MYVHRSHLTRLTEQTKLVKYVMHRVSMKLGSPDEVTAGRDASASGTETHWGRLTCAFPGAGTIASSEAARLDLAGPENDDRMSPDGRAKVSRKRNGHREPSGPTTGQMSRRDTGVTVGPARRPSRDRGVKRDGPHRVFLFRPASSTGPNSSRFPRRNVKPDSGAKGISGPAPTPSYG